MWETVCAVLVWGLAPLSVVGDPGGDGEPGYVFYMGAVVGETVPQAHFGPAYCIRLLLLRNRLAQTPQAFGSKFGHELSRELLVPWARHLLFYQFSARAWWEKLLREPS